MLARYICIVLPLLLVLSPVIGGYCGNPYVADNPDYYCNQDIPLQECCPDDESVYGGENYPSDQADCQANFFSDSIDNIDACQEGCCYYENQDPLCEPDTEFICEDSTGYLIEGSLLNSPPCTTQSGEYRYALCEDEENVCSNHNDSPSACSQAGCLWCDNTPTSCVESCSDCDGKPLESGGECQAEAGGQCSVIDNQGDCQDVSGCFFCPIGTTDPSGGESPLCVDDCAQCSGYNEIDYSDDTCITEFDCSSFDVDNSNQRDQCIARAECQLCLSDESGNEACVSNTCEGCDYEFPGDDGRCLDGCHNNIDEGFSGMDMEDVCCTYYDEQDYSSPFNENTSCIPSCETGKRIDQSGSLTTVNGVDYCTCGEEGQTGIRKLVSAQDEGHLSCCENEGDLFGKSLSAGECETEDLTIELFYEDDTPVDCASSSDGCRISITSAISGELVESTTNGWSGTNGNQYILNTFYPQDITVEIYHESGDYETITETFTFNGAQTEDFYLTELDDTCFYHSLNTDSIEFNFTPPHCSDDYLDFSWDLLSDDTSCLDKVKLINISPVSNLLQPIILTEEETILSKTLSKTSQQTGLSFGQSEEYTVTFKIECDPDDAYCNDNDLNTFSLDTHVTISPGDKLCALEEGYCDVADTDKEFCYTQDNTHHVVNCDEKNNFVILNDCTPHEQHCAETSSGVSCQAVSNCNASGIADQNIFSMYNDIYGSSSIEDNPCLYEDGEERYCYVDLSQTTADECKYCHYDTDCYSYQTQGACELNHCQNPLPSAKDCQWYPSPEFEDLGKGYCYSPGYQGTENCNMCGEGLFYNMNCTAEVCDVLGGCYPEDDAYEGCLECKEPDQEDGPTSCDEFIDEKSCVGITEDWQTNQPFNIEGGTCIGRECGTEEEINYSADQCDIGLCKWIDGACVKDANDDDVSDCAHLEGQEKRRCQKDIYPPVTNVSAPGTITEKGSIVTFFISHPHEGDGEDTRLYYCTDTENECYPNNLTKTSSSSVELTLDGENFPDINDTEGYVYLRYFSVDKYNNTEPIKTRELAADTRVPRIDTDVAYFVRHNLNKVNVSLRPDEFVQQCGICMARFTDIDNYDECINAPDSQTGPNGPITSMFNDYTYFSIEEGVQKNFTIPVGQGAYDGSWTVAIQCQDFFGNVWEYRDLIFMDEERAIKEISPYSEIYSDYEINHGELEISFKTPGKELNCFYETLEGDMHLFEGSEMTPEEGETYSYKTLMADIYDPSHEGYHELKITCTNRSNECSQWPLSTGCTTGEAVSKFVIDGRAPSTSVRYCQEDSDIYGCEDIDDSKYYTRKDWLQIVCDDGGEDFRIYQDPDNPTNNNYRPFECANLTYCINPSDDNTLNECDPNTTISYGSKLSGFRKKIEADEIIPDGTNESITICFSSVDNGLNDEDVSCQLIPIDTEPPEMIIDNPENGTLFGPEEISMAGGGVTIEGELRDNVAKRIYLYNVQENGTHLNEETRIFPVNGETNQYDGYRATGFEFPVSLYYGKNNFEFWYGETGQEGENKGGPLYYTLFWDHIGPEEITINSILNGERSNIHNSNSVDYGEDIIFNLSVNDPRWAKDQIGAVYVQLTCLNESFCYRYPVKEHYFQLSKKGSYWYRNLTPNPGSYLPSGDSLDENTNYDLFPGTYNITVFAWDGYNTSPIRLNLGDAPDFDYSCCNLNKENKGTLLIEDKTNPEIEISFADEYPSKYTSLQRFGINKFSSSYIDVQASSTEPIYISDLSVELRNGNCGFELPLEENINDRFYRYRLEVPNLNCLKEIQDHGGIGNNTMFTIRFNDSFGVEYHEEEIVQNRYFEIDTKGPLLEIFDSYDPSIRDSSINVTGMIYYIKGIGEIDGTLKYKINNSNGESIHETQTVFSEPVLETYSINEDANSGDTVIQVQDTSANCEDTEVLNDNYYIHFLGHERTHRVYYPIQDISSCLNGYREITLETPLESDVSSQEDFELFDNFAPRGWFNTEINLEEGFNNITLISEDYLENKGGNETINIFYDNSPPRMEELKPKNGSITGDIRKNISFTLDDRNGLGTQGINTDSIIVIINHTEGDTYTLSANDMANRVFDMNFEPKEGPVINVTISPRNDMDNGIYKITAYAEDMVRFNVTKNWHFEINDKVPKTPEVYLGELAGKDYGGRDFGTWYTNDNNTGFYLVFDENEVINLTYINLTTDDSDVECAGIPGYNYAFDCQTSGELAQGMKLLNVMASKKIGEFGGDNVTGPVGYFPDIPFIVDITEPSLELNPIPKSREYLNRTVSGSASDNPRENIFGIDQIIINEDTQLGKEYIIESGFSGFDKIINLSSGEGEKEVSVTAVDKAGNSITKIINAEIDRKVLAAVLDPIPSPVKEDFTVSGHTQELDTRVEIIVNHSNSGYSVEVPRIPDPQLETINLNSSFCNGQMEFKYPLRKKISFLNENYDTFTIELTTPSGISTSETLGQGDNSQEIILDEEGTYSLTTYAGGAGQQCRTVYDIDVDEDRNYDFEVFLDGLFSRYTDSTSIPIYSKITDSVGNVNYSRAQSVYLDNIDPKLDSYFPENNYNENVFRPEFTISDDYGINISSLSLKFNGSTYEYGSGFFTILNEETNAYGTNVYSLQGDELYVENDETYMIKLEFADIAGRVVSEDWVFTVDNETPSEPTFMYDGEVAEENYYFNSTEPDINIWFYEAMEFPLTSGKLYYDGDEISSISEYIIPIDEENKTFSFNYSLEERKKGYELHIYGKRFGLGSIGGPYVSPVFHIDTEDPVIEFFNSNEKGNSIPTIEGIIHQDTYESMNRDDGRQIFAEKDEIAEGLFENQSTEFIIPLTERLLEQGDNNITVYATDKAGNQVNKIWEYSYDSIPPEYVRLKPDVLFDGIYFAEDGLIDLEVEISETPLEVEIYRDGVLIDDYQQREDAVNRSISLGNGYNEVYARVTDDHGNVMVSDNITIIFDSTGPAFSDMRPAPESVIGLEVPDVSVIVSDPNSGVDIESLSFTINTIDIPVKDLSIDEVGTGKYKVACGSACKNHMKGNWNVYHSQGDSSNNYVQVGAKNKAGTLNSTSWFFDLNMDAPYIESWTPDTGEHIDTTTPKIVFRFRNYSLVTNAELDGEDITDDIYTKDYINYWYACNDSESFREEWRFNITGSFELVDSDTPLTVVFDSSVTVESFILDGEDIYSGTGTDHSIGMIPEGTSPEFTIIGTGLPSSVDFSVKVPRSEGIEVKYGEDNQNYIEYATLDGYVYEKVKRSTNTLKDARHHLSIEAKSYNFDEGYGSTMSDSNEFVVDTHAPNIEITGNNYFASRTVNLTGIWDDNSHPEETIDSISIGARGHPSTECSIFNDRFRCEDVRLGEGKNEVTAIISDIAGHTGNFTKNIYVNGDGPSILLDADLDTWLDSNIFVTNSDTVTLKAIPEFSGPDAQVYVSQDEVSIIEQTVTQEITDTLLLEAGETTISANITDRYGLSDEHTIHIIYDNTVPEVEFVYPGEDAVIGSFIPTLRLRASDTGTEVNEIKLSINGETVDHTFDGINITANPNLVEGENTVTVTVKDIVGNTQSYNWSFTVDPSVPKFDRFISPQDYTKNNTPLYSFRFIDPATLTGVNLDGSDIKDEFEVENDRLFYATGDVQDGEHVLDVKAVKKEIGGNEANLRNKFIVDTVPPKISIDQENGIYGECDLEIRGSYDEQFIDTIKSRLDYGDSKNVNIDEINKEFRTDVKLTPYESHVLNITAKDMAGNKNTTGIELSCDPHPPVVTISVSENVTKDNTVSVTVNTDEESDIFIHGTEHHGTQVTETVSLTPGLNEIYATARDSVGNEGESRHVFVMYDNEAPEILSVMPGQDDIIGNDKMTISALCEDSGSGIDETRSEWVVNNEQKTGSFDGERFIIETELLSTNSIEFTCYDKAGNSNEKVWEFDVNEDAPKFDEFSEPPYYTNKDPVETSFSFMEPVNIDSVRINNDIINVNTENQIEYTGDLGSLHEGQHTLRIQAKKAIDDAVASSDNSFEFIVDRTKPTVTIDSHEEYVSSLSMEISGDVSDENGIERVEVSVNGGLASEVDHLDSINGKYHAEVKLTKETNEIRIIAYDKAGNKESIETTVHLDTSFPLIAIEDVEPAMKIAPGTFRSGLSMVNLTGSYFSKYIDSIYSIDNPERKASLEDNIFLLLMGLKGKKDNEIQNQVELEIKDKMGRKNDDSVIVISDQRGPGISLKEPKQAIKDTNPTIIISTDEAAKECRADSEMEKISDYEFRHTTELEENTLNQLRITCEDYVGNSNSKTIGIVVDTIPPEIRNISVEYGFSDIETGTATVFHNETRISLSASEPVICKYNEIPFSNFVSGNHEKTDTSELIQIENDVYHDYSIQCEDKAGNIMDPYMLEIYGDLDAPIQIFNHDPSGYTNINDPVISFETFIRADCEVSFYKNGNWTDAVTATRNKDKHYEYKVKSSHVDSSLNLLRNEKEYIFRTKCYDPNGIRIQGEETFSYIYDNELMQPVITYPFEGFLTSDQLIPLNATNEENVTVQLYINGKKQGPEKQFEDEIHYEEIILDNGENEITIEVEDRAGNVKNASVSGDFIWTGPLIEGIIPLPGSILPELDLVRVIVYDYEGVGLNFDESSIKLMKGADQIPGSVYEYDNRTLAFEPYEELTNGEYYVEASIYDNKYRNVKGASYFTIRKGTPNMTLIAPEDWAGVWTNEKDADFRGEIESKGVITSADFMINSTRSLCEGDTCDYDGYIDFDFTQNLIQEGLNYYSFWLENSINDGYSLYKGNILRDTVGLDYLDMQVLNSQQYSANVLKVTSAIDRGEDEIDYTNELTPIIDVRFDEQVKLKDYNLVKEGDGSDIPVEMVENEQKIYFYFRPVSSLDEGTYYFKINATDIHNNPIEYNPVTRTFIIDRTDPEIEITTPEDGAVIKDSQVQVQVGSSEPVRINKALINDRDVSDEFESLYMNQFTKILKIDDGETTLDFELEDYAGNTGSDSITFRVVTKPLKIEIVEPSYGVSNSKQYEFIVNTSRKASCRYDLARDRDYSDMVQMDSIDGFNHRIPSLSDVSTIYVRCRDVYDFESQETFTITFDSERPEITSLSVSPPKITENPEIEISVETNEDTICFYQDNNKNQHEFENNEFSQSHTTRAQTPTNKGSYQYIVRCQDKASWFSTPKVAAFEVDLSSSFTITDNTPDYFTETEIYLNISSNMRAKCYYGDSIGARKDNRMKSNDDYSFYEEFTAEEGENRYFVWCHRYDDTGETDELITKVIVDTSSPVMKYVDVSNPELDGSYETWRTDRIYAEWAAEDNESGIDKYYYKVYEHKMSGNSRIKEGQTSKEKYTITGLNMVDGNEYFVQVYARNNAGKTSDDMDSEYLLVDKSLKPEESGGGSGSPSCDDGLLNQDETDVDCGGQHCGPCEGGMVCEDDGDCKSGNCLNGTCVDNQTECDILVDLDCDGVQNHLDEDIDGDGLTNWEDPDDDDDGVCDTLVSPLNEGCSGDDDDDNSNEILDPEDKDILEDWCYNKETDIHKKGTCADNNMEGQDKKDGDLDNDGVPNFKDPDIDGDGLMNWEDPDDDNDGLCDTAESPLNTQNGTELCTGEDDDDDNDGILDPQDKDIVEMWCYDEYADAYQKGSCTDMDGEVVLDGDLDNNGVPNFRDEDIDGDGLVNWEDPDDDNDGLCDTAESPLNIKNETELCTEDDDDDDNDGILDPEDKDPDNDLDNDGVKNNEDDDMDGDGIPNDEDSDNDNDGIVDSEDDDKNNNGIPDREEDDDGDGMTNGWELDNGLNPNDPNDAHEDPDGDGLTNLEEHNVKDTKWGGSTDPHDEDTDGDGWSDKEELDKGYDPLDPDDHPKSIWPFILVILLILILAGVGGYFGYRKYTEYGSFNDMMNDFMRKLGIKKRNKPAKSMPVPPMQQTKKTQQAQQKQQPIQQPQYQQSKREEPKLSTKKTNISDLEQTKQDYISLRAIKDNAISKYINLKEISDEDKRVLHSLTLDEIDQLLKGKDKQQIKIAVRKLRGNKTAIDDLDKFKSDKTYKDIKSILGKNQRKGTFDELKNLTKKDKISEKHLKDTFGQLSERLSAKKQGEVLKKLVDDKKITKKQAENTANSVKKKLSPKSSKNLKKAIEDIKKIKK